MITRSKGKTRTHSDAELPFDNQDPPKPPKKKSTTVKKATAQLSSDDQADPAPPPTQKPKPKPRPIKKAEIAAQAWARKEAEQHARHQAATRQISQFEATRHATDAAAAIKSKQHPRMMPEVIISGQRGGKGNVKAHGGSSTIQKDHSNSQMSQNKV
ncbi:hypothetical protein EWM64_g9456 [Hericium alpestre]|uniref:Uncharacterized protein n=1 Tax=Hericium alpestre TaxID=135208 RepID=A0A4Y9ZIG9_9AGAM|nr:hypothetical protein EWM64_g9456 [Hericium alpestre]